MSESSLHFHQYFQHTDYTCGPTALKMAFEYFGLKLSENHLACEAHTSKKIGTCHKAMIEAARHHGFYVYVNNNSSLKEIEYLIANKRPVIIHFIEHTENEGHYSLVHKIDRKKIHLSDPWFGKRLSYTREEFEKRWNSEDHKHPQWLMSIGKEAFVEGREYQPHKH